MVKNIKNEKLASALCYILFGVLWYFIDEDLKKSKDVKYHSKQGINLFLFWIGLGAICQVISRIFIMTYILAPLAWILTQLLSIFFLVIIIIGIYNSLNFKRVELPFIGKYAKKYLNY